MKQNRVRTAIALLFLGCALGAHGEDPFEGARGKVNIGQTLEQCRSGIKYRELSSVETSDLLNSHPWVETHCFLLGALKAKRVVAWTDDKKAFVSWPMYVFGTFSEDGKLVDLIGSNWGYTQPLVAGTYATRVANLKKGMNVSEMYELVGRQAPEYRKGQDGKWIVRFTYNGYPSQFYVVEADAGSGMITRAFNGTI